MGQRITESDTVDLYEEMLYERAAKGIRPVLYVSSRKDLECGVVMLLDRPAELRFAGRQLPAAMGTRYHVRAN